MQMRRAKGFGFSRTYSNVLNEHASQRVCRRIMAKRIMNMGIQLNFRCMHTYGIVKLSQRVSSLCSHPSVLVVCLVHVGNRDIQVSLCVCVLFCENWYNEEHRANVRIGRTSSTGRADQEKGVYKRKTLICILLSCVYMLLHIMLIYSNKQQSLSLCRSSSILFAHPQRVFLSREIARLPIPHPHHPQPQKKSDPTSSFYQIL